MRRRRGITGAGNLGCLIWLVVLVLVGHVLWKVVPVKIRTSTFYDSMQEQASFGSIKSDHQIEYEVLQPILDPLEAMKRDAPVIKHEGSEAGIHVDRSEEKIHAAGAGNLEEEESLEELNNVSSQVHFKRGDLEQGFKEAEAIVEGRWISSSVHQAYMEPNGTVAHWDASGSVSIWTSISIGVPRIRSASGCSHSRMLPRSVRRDGAL